MKTFKVKIKYLTPVASVLALSYIFSNLLLATYVVSPVSATPFSEAGFGPTFNALYFTGIIAAAGFAIYMLIHFKLVKTLKFLLALVYSVMIFVLTGVYMPAFLWLANLGGLAQNFHILIISEAIIVPLIIYGVFIRKGKVSQVLSLIVSAGLGSFLGFIIPVLSAIAILVALSIYDIVAVTKGPVGKIAANIDSANLSTLTLLYHDVYIGLGDLIFYSLLAANSYIFLGTLPSIAAVLGMLGGAYLSFKMLERQKMFPGLPITLTFGIASAFIVYYLLGSL